MNLTSARGIMPFVNWRKVIDVDSFIRRAYCEVFRCDMVIIVIGHVHMSNAHWTFLFGQWTFLLSNGRMKVQCFDRRFRNILLMLTRIINQINGLLQSLLL